PRRTDRFTVRPAQGLSAGTDQFLTTRGGSTTLTVIKITGTPAAANVTEAYASDKTMLAQNAPPASVALGGNIDSGDSRLLDAMSRTIRRGGGTISRLLSTRYSPNASGWWVSIRRIPRARIGALSSRGRATAQAATATATVGATAQRERSARIPRLRVVPTRGRRISRTTASWIARMSLF